MKIGQGKKKKLLVCHYCKRVGHIQKKCRQTLRDTERERKPGKPVKPTLRQDSTVSFALPAEAKLKTESSLGSWTRARQATPLRAENFSWSCKHVTLADGKKAIMEGEGPGVIQCYDDKGKQTEMKLSKALHTPTLAMNLLSVPSLAQKNATVIFDVNGCRVMHGNRTAAIATFKQGLYYLKQPSSWRPGIIRRAACTNGIESSGIVTPIPSFKWRRSTWSTVCVFANVKQPKSASAAVRVKAPVRLSPRNQNSVRRRPWISCTQMCVVRWKYRR